MEPGRLEAGILNDLGFEVLPALTMEGIYGMRDRAGADGPASRRRSWAVAALLLCMGLAWGCRSPNRGVWKGTFEGSVHGTVEFRINARGTRLSGSMAGATRENQPFRAEMEGTIHGDHFYATFEGASRAGALPVAFEGFLRGTLAAGRGAGDWQCELTVTRQKLKGEWQVEQAEVE